MESSRSNGEPQICVEQISAEQKNEAGFWQIAWEVKNTAAQLIRLLSVRLPHGQFKSGEMRFNPAFDLAPQAQERFETDVRCNEPSGLVTENAFLIFQAIWQKEAWRLFVRVSVIVGKDGLPCAKVESVTTQKVGFSGVAS